MNKKLFNVILFATGAVIGSVATWMTIKTKYEHIAQEEINSVREEYNRLNKLMRKEIDACRKITNPDQNDADESDSGEEEKYEQQVIVEYNRIANNYRTNNEKNNEEGGNEDDDFPCTDEPYVITPEDFASSPPGYNASPLDYFSDGVLADGWGVQMDIEDTIGEEALNHFGDYVDDLVYVRNDRNEIDYEVTKDPRTYAECFQAGSSSYSDQ